MLRCSRIRGLGSGCLAQPSMPALMGGRWRWRERRDAKIVERPPRLRAGRPGRGRDRRSNPGHPVPPPIRGRVGLPAGAGGLGEALAMKRPLEVRIAARRHRVPPPIVPVAPAPVLAAWTARVVGALCAAAAVWAIGGGTLAAPVPPAAAARTGSGGTSATVADPTYAALRAARPDGRVVAVHGLVLDRDVFHFELESGTVHFLEPVAGRTIGAVFLGHGTLRLSPASAAERRQLALELGEGKDFEVLTDSFDELVLLFGDDTAQEIAAAAPIAKQAPDPRARQVYERWLERQRRDSQLNLQLRLLRDLLNVPAPAAAASAPAG